MAREFSKPFYNSPEWQRVRQTVLMRDRFLCVKCGKPAEEVHHIKELTPQNITDPCITLSYTNLAALCHNCHMKRHHPHMKRYKVDEYGRVTPND